MVPDMEDYEPYGLLGNAIYDHPDTPAHETKRAKAGIIHLMKTGNYSDIKAVPEVNIQQVNLQTASVTSSLSYLYTDKHLSNYNLFYLLTDYVD